MSDAVTELAGLEYQKLKDEQVARIGQRDGLIYVTLATIAGVIFGSVKLSSPLPLLALPLAVGLLGWLYLQNDRKISEIGAYLREELTPKVAAYNAGFHPFGWERHHSTVASRRTRKRGQLIADMAAFVLPALVAIIAMWWQNPPWWAAALSVFELAAIAGLGREIYLASRP